MVATEKLLLTAEDIARRLNCTPRQVYRLVHDGMPHMRPSPRLLRFDWDEVWAWLQTRKVTAS